MNKVFGNLLLWMCVLFCTQVSAETLSAQYTIENFWTSGYQVTVTLKNNSSQPTKTWGATFSLPLGQKITSFWNGVYSANGQEIKVSNPTWIGGGVIPANGSTTFGMVISNPQNTVRELQNLAASSNGSTPILPSTPQLNPISLQPGSTNTYTVSWSSSNNATSYALQQDTNGSFSNPITVFQGNALSKSFSNQSNGTYYYRVSASNSSGTSGYSNVQSVYINSGGSGSTAAIVEGYWESWNSSTSVNTIANMHSEIINISFANFRTTGTHTFAIAGVECDQATLNQLVTYAHSLGKKVKIAIGGATYPLQPQLQTTQDAIGMANAIAQYIHQNNLDGVDFDIEDYPAPELQSALIEQTKQLLGNQALISYTAKSPASTTFPYNQVISTSHDDLSYISIMAYDYGPGYTYQQDVTNLIAMGVPSNKIIVGLMPGYDDLGVLTSIGDIEDAAQFVVDNHLGGIMFWSLNRDHENSTGLGVDAATNTAWNIIH